MSDAPEQIILESESLKQLSPGQMVRIILQQQQLIEQLQQELERLKAQQRTDSQTSSKPPSSDLLVKSEKYQEATQKAQEGKRKPGGQPGHPGKTRKGFGRVDKYEVLRPRSCPNCGGEQFVEAAVAVQRFSGGKTGRATDRSGRISASNLPVRCMWSTGECVACY